MNFNDALLSVQLIIESGSVPLLVGESGIGKTALAKKLCNINEYIYINIDGNLLKEGEIGGLPVVEDYLVDYSGKEVKKKRTVYAVHHKLQKIDEIMQENRTSKVLIFIDEINRCEHAVQQELMNIVLNREINGYILPQNTVIMAAMNPSNKYDTYSDNEYKVVEMDPAQENRFVWVNLESDADNWISWGKEEDKDHIYSQNIHDDVLEFIAAFPQYLNRPDSQESVKPAPRSWERVSDSYRIFINKKDLIPERIFINIVKGNVGTSIAQEFINFIHDKENKILSANEVLNMHEVDSVLLNKLKTQSHEKLYLLALNCIETISKAIENKNMIKVFSNVLSHYPSDLRLAIMKKIKNDHADTIYKSFLDENEFINAYFKIFLKG